MAELPRKFIVISRDIVHGISRTNVAGWVMKLIVLERYRSNDRLSKRENRLLERRPFVEKLTGSPLTCQQRALARNVDFHFIVPVSERTYTFHVHGTSW